MAIVTTEEWNNTCKELAEKFTDERLKKLFNDKYEVYGKTMAGYVAAKSHHHNYIGGLQQHTYEMLKSFLALYNTGLYPVVPDYIILAVMYHDLAKVYEYKATQYDNGYVSIECTPYMSLIGHLYGSARILEKDLDTVEGLEQDVKNQIIHCVLAHHGLKEWDAIRLPNTPEANFVHQLDMLSSRCTSVKTK